MVIILLIVSTIFSGMLGQLVKLPFSSGNIYLLDVLVIITVTVWVFTKFVSFDYNFKLPKFFIPLFFFLLWVLITLVVGKREVSPEEFMNGGFYFIRLSFYSFFSLIIYDLKNNKSNPLSAVFLSKVLIFSSLLLAVSGFVQLLIYPDLSKLAAEFGYDPHKNRLVSTFLDPNFTAAYLVLGLSLILALSSGVRGNSKKWYWLAGFILFAALIFTFSRSGWIMFSAVLLLFGLLRSPKLLLVAMLAGFLAYFAVPRVQTRISGITDPDDSAKLRLVSWSRAVTIFGDNPIFGVGYNLYRPAQERYGFFNFHDLEGGHAGSGSDSSFLLVLATTGVVGFILLLLLNGYIFVQSIKSRRTVVGMALALSIFGLFFDSQFINSLFFPQIMLWIWILVGLV